MAVLSNEYFLLGNQIYGKKGTKSYILNDAAYRQVKLAIDKDNTSPLSPANAKFLREKGVIYESNEINNPVCVISDMNLCRLFVQLTNRCNLRCKHCFVESDMTKDDYLTYESFLYTINRSRD